MNNCTKLNHLDLKKITPDMKEPIQKPQLKTEESVIPSENLISSISHEWQLEMDRIKSRGLNFFRRKKETLNESLIQSGHAEI